MTSSKLINYTTREFMSDHELEQYIAKQNEIFTPKVVEEFTKAGMLRRVLTKLWNKEGVHRVGILFEYRDEKAFAACQSLLEKHYIPMVKTFITKVVGSRGIVVHEFSSEEFNIRFIASNFWLIKEVSLQHLSISSCVSCPFSIGSNPKIP